MENPNNYACPRICPLRSVTCHATCERHEKYRELIEARRREIAKSRRLDTVAAHRIAFKYNQKWV